MDELENLRAELTDTQLVLGQKEMTVQRLQQALQNALAEVARLKKVSKEDDPQAE